jgi:DNA-directed RNA polymerase specialized sigma24 family protein
MIMSGIGVRWRRYEGMAVAEIAEVMDVSPGVYAVAATYRGR